MYVSRPYYCIGEQYKAEDIESIEPGSPVYDAFLENHVEHFNKIDTSLAKATHSVVAELLDSEGLEGADIQAVVFNHVCETDNEELDRSLDEILTDLGLVNVPLSRVGGGQCGSGVILLNQAKDLLELKGESARTVIVIEANVVEDFQPREYMDGRTVLSDGVVAYAAQANSGMYEVIDTVTVYNHKVRHLQQSGNPIAAIQALQQTKETLNMGLSIISAAASRALDAFNMIFTSNSYVAVQQFRESFGFPESKIYTKNISRHGHYFGAEIFYNVYEYDRDGHFNPDDILLLFHCGYSAFGFTALRKAT